MPFRKIVFLLVALLVLIGVCFGFYYLPPVQSRLAWRIDGLRAQIKYALDPPDQIIFVPQEQVDAAVKATLQAMSVGPEQVNQDPEVLPVTATPTLAGSTASPQPSATPQPTATPAPTATPIPQASLLSGVRHEYQSFNNCGPATLSMALSFWGWEGSQADVRLVMRPHPDDYNVMPEEMVSFVERQTNLKAIVRVGGDVETLKRFVAAGFPIVVEKGIQPAGEWWMGHYVLVTGYNDTWGYAEPFGAFITQDSYVMPDYPVPYKDFEEHWWRDFNYTYLVIYPPEHEGEVIDLLGEQSDSENNLRHALEVAEAEIEGQQGRDLFFAWYNKGSSLVGMQDYLGATAAFDQAFALYPKIPEKDRPWRLLWYQIGPYPAYYYTGRYQDVTNLANTTLGRLNKGGLEESYYWRGMALSALADEERAQADFTKAVELNSNYILAIRELEKRGLPVP
jgi:hypothetical protein